MEIKVRGCLKLCMKVVRCFSSCDSGRCHNPQKFQGVVVLNLFLRDEGQLLAKQRSIGLGAKKRTVGSERFIKEVCIYLIPKRSDEVCSTLPPREEEPLNPSYAAAEGLGTEWGRFEGDQEETAQVDRGRSAVGFSGSGEEWC